MAYDSGLAHRIRDTLHSSYELEFEEREMFGGIGFMLDEKMCCGVIDDKLVARVGEGAYVDALVRPHTSEFDFTGRPMQGWVYVDQAGLGTGDELQEWVEQCVEFVKTLPEE